MDEIEECGARIDLGLLAGERRSEIEAKTVDMALARPVAKRVHHQAEHVRMRGIERVTRSRDVDIAPRVSRIMAIVRVVVDPAERQRRPLCPALGGVVVDHVEDHFDAGAVERLDHPLELAYLLAGSTRRSIEGVGGEITDRGVAPVVRETLVVEELLVCALVDREQLDRGHAERAQIGDRLVRGKSRVGAAKVAADGPVLHREALDVQL